MVIVMKDENNEEEKYIYVGIEYEDNLGGKTYFYRTNDDTLDYGDRVLVERFGNKTSGIIVEKGCYCANEVPYPLEKTKFVIEKLGGSYEVDAIEDYLLQENSDYYKILLNAMFGKIQIKRLMKLISYDSVLDGWQLYYYPKLNMFFYKHGSDDLFKIAEYGSELIKLEMFKIIYKSSILVLQAKKGTADGNLYYMAIKYCEACNLLYYDDTDVLEYTNEKNQLFPQKAINDFVFNNIDEIIDYLQHYKKAKWKRPNQEYYIDGDKIVYYIGGLNYAEDGKVFKIFNFLMLNDYLDDQSPKVSFPMLVNGIGNYNFKVLDFERTSAVIFKLFALERMCEGIVDRFASDGSLLTLVERLVYFKEHITERYKNSRQDQKIIFRYELLNAWQKPLQFLMIKDSDKDNVILEDEKQFKVLSIASEDIKKIMEILDNNPSLFTIQDVDFPPVLDGTIHRFYFRNGLAKLDIEAFNIWYYLKNSKAGDDTKLIIKVFNEIAKVLGKYDINLLLDERKLIGT